MAGTDLSVAETIKPIKFDKTDKEKRINQKLNVKSGILNKRMPKIVRKKDWNALRMIKKITFEL